MWSVIISFWGINQSYEFMNSDMSIILSIYLSCLTHEVVGLFKIWQHFVTGIHVLAKFEGVADRKIYRVNRYIISGHSLEHLCLAMVPVLLSIMLMYRNMKFQRYFSLAIKLNKLFCGHFSVSWNWNYSILVFF